MWSKTEKSSRQHVKQEHQPKWSNREVWLELIVSGVLVTLPVLLLAGVLIGIVFIYQVQHHEPISQFRYSNITSERADAFFVNFDATKLTTVASWASSIASILPAFFMTLWSYRYAAEVKRLSEGSKVEELPSPYQLSLMLSMRSGSLASFWESMRYAIARPKERLTRLFWMIFSTTLVIGWAIWATDTWLHVSTTTVEFTNAISIEKPTNSFGRALPTNCTTGEPKYCTVQYVPTRSTYLVEPVGVYQTLNNISSTNQILTTGIGNKTVSYLAPADNGDEIDYQASTYAAETTCTLATNYCYQNEGDQKTGKFNCSVAYNYNVSSTTGKSSGTDLTSIWFQDPGWTQIMSPDATSNPFYTVFRYFSSQAQYISSSVGDQMASDVYGDLVFFMNCTTHLYDLEYTYTSGSVNAGNLTLITNPIAISAIIEPVQVGFTQKYLSNGALLSYMETTTDALLSTFAEYYNTALLAPPSSVSEKILNTAEQMRETFLVSRVPKAPLFALLACLLLSVIYGVTILIMALTAHPLKNRPFQLQLSIPGIISSRFEDCGKHLPRPARSTEQLFLERQLDHEGYENEPRSRIGVLPAIGMDGSTYLDYGHWISETVDPSKDPNAISMHPGDNMSFDRGIQPDPCTNEAKTSSKTTSPSLPSHVYGHGQMTLSDFVQPFNFGFDTSTSYKHPMAYQRVVETEVDDDDNNNNNEPGGHDDHSSISSVSTSNSHRSTHDRRISNADDEDRIHDPYYHHMNTPERRSRSRSRSRSDSPSRLMR